MSRWTEKDLAERVATNPNLHVQSRRSQVRRATILGQIADRKGTFLSAWHVFCDFDAPSPESEFRFMEDRKFRFDWAFPDYKVAVEVDGIAWVKGGGRHAQDADREKMNQAVLHGWAVLHFSPHQLEANPEECVKIVSQVLAKRGQT